jgi:hypothetical protein
MNACAGGVVYTLFQHELQRLLASHSIENIGIIVLGLQNPRRRPGGTSPLTYCAWRSSS